MRARQTNLFLAVLGALLLSLCTGLAGSTLSKTVKINPQISRVGIFGIDSNGWTETTAQLDLIHDSVRNSNVLISFDSWRPAGSGPAQLTFEACGKEIQSALITKNNTSVALKLPSDCDTKTLAIITKNPFKSADKRVLGVQVSKIELNNPFLDSIHFDNKAIIAAVALFLLFLALIALGIQKLSLLFSYVLFSLLTLLSMNTLAWDNQWQLLSLAAVLILFALGLNLKLSPKFNSGVGFSGASTFSVSLKIAVFVLFLIAALIRFYGADFGLPDRYHPDEPRKAGIALKMALVGDLNPNYFLHPTLLLYLTALVGKTGHLLGLYPELNTVVMNLSGRLVSAAAGALTVPVLFLIGQCLFSNRVGMLASAAFAFAPLHVTCSRYLKEDTLLTFFVVLVVWICIRAVKRDRPRDLLLAGFVAGLASSSKYSGALSCVAIALAPWLKSRSFIPDPRFFVWGAISAIFVPVGFILASPYVVLNYDKFITHFKAEQGHMITGHHKVIISSWSQYWMYHLSRSIVPGSTWFVTALGILGFGAMLRSAGVKGFYIIAVFCAFYLPAEAVNAKPPPQPERYILPCIPFIFLAAAVAVDSLRLWGRGFIALVLGFFLIACPFYRSIGLAYELSPDTRVLMRDWITENVPKGSKIIVDAQAYSAFLPQDQFVVTPMWTIDQRREMTIENLKAQEIDYILLTNKSYDRYFLTQSADQRIRVRFEDIFQNWVLVKEMKSNFGSFGFSNPELRIYKVERKSN